MTQTNPDLSTIMTTYGFSTEAEAVSFLLASFKPAPASIAEPEPVPVVVAEEESEPVKLFHRILASLERREQAKMKAMKS